MISMKFDILLDILIEHFLVSIPLGYLVVANRVYRKCHAVVPHRVTPYDMVELELFDFDIILGVD